MKTLSLILHTTPAHIATWLLQQTAGGLYLTTGPGRVVVQPARHAPPEGGLSLASARSLAMDAYLAGAEGGAAIFWPLGTGMRFKAIPLGPGRPGAARPRRCRERPAPGRRR